MATRAPERGGLERRQVARAEVLATDATGFLARTEAYPDPWPTGPFLAPPDRSRSEEGRLRIEAVADTVLRVRYVPGSEVRDGGRHMLVVAPSPATAVPVEVAAAAGRVVLRTPAMTAEATLDPFLGLDKTGQTLDLWVSDAMGAHTARSYKPVPFWRTTGGWGVFLHTSSRVTAWVGSRAAHQVQVAVYDDLLDYFVLLGSPAGILAAYTALTGRAPVRPAWSFGWWQSRCSYSSAAEVLEVIEEMRAAGVPMDVVHLDTKWFATDWRCDLEFAPDQFDDPACDLLDFGEAWELMLLSSTAGCRWGWRGSASGRPTSAAPASSPTTPSCWSAGSCGRCCCPTRGSTGWGSGPRAAGPSRPGRWPATGSGSATGCCPMSWPRPSRRPPPGCRSPGRWCWSSRRPGHLAARRPVPVRPLDPGRAAV